MTLAISKCQKRKYIKNNHGKKSMKMESWLEKINTGYDDPKKLSTTKTNSHTSSGYSPFTHCSLDTTKNKLDYYRGKDFIKKFCIDIRKHPTKNN